MLLRHQGEEAAFILSPLGQQAPGMLDETGIDGGEFPNLGKFLRQMMRETLLNFLPK